MHLQKIPFRSTHAFSEFFLKYIEADKSLAPFYNRFPSVESFEGQLKEKSGFPAAHRTVLVKSLQRQYKALKLSPAVEANIIALGDKKTFTVTTGHQLAIFTGPLYFIYKIVTVIKACRTLKAKYPSYNFVPVYWMASEDHDYEEIKSFRLYGKKYTWETNQQGAVGRFHTKDFKTLLTEIPGELGLFREAYSKSSNLADATRHFVNALFGNEGLVVVDGDDKELKQLFSSIIPKDLFDHAPNRLVTETNAQLEKLGFDPQVNPREINLFYLDNQLRSRIEKKEKEFIVVDTSLKFSREELTKKIAESPEVFSPNVILRPVYQETILPNLAYVGGPAELVYWLELKSVFAHCNVPFPILLPRNFGLIVDGPTSRKIGKTKLPLDAFFLPKNDVLKQWVISNSGYNLSLDTTSQAIGELLTDVQKRAQTIDATLGPMTLAHATRIQKMLSTIEQKMVRAEKRANADGVRQVEAIKDALFPNEGLQERTDNFLNFYQSDPTFIQTLLTHFDPFDFQMHVFTYDDQEGNSKAVS